MAYRELELTLVSARDLKNVNLITRMDVYAVVTISGDPLTRQCTAPDPSGGRNPRWDATLRFAVPPTADAAAGSCLHVLLRAERVLGDRDVGEVIIPLADLLAGAPATGPQQPRVASYQVRKVHRWEPRGVLHVSYRLGSVVAPVVENKPPPPAVMDMGYSYPPVGVPSSSQPFHPQADAYQPPQPAHPPRPAAKANKHDPAPAPAPSPSPRNGKSNGLGQVFVGPHTQIIFGGGGGGPPATTTTMSSSSSPTGSNVSSPRKPHGAWHTRQMELHHDHGDTQGRRPFQETEATSQLRAPVPAASREGAAAAGATVSPRGPSPRPPVSTFSSHSSGSFSPPPYSTASQRAPVVVAASATMSPRGPSRQLPVSTSFSSHGSSSSRSPPPDSPARRFPFTPSPARSATHSSTNSPYTARHPSTTPSPRALGHSATTDTFGSSDTKSSPCVPTHGRAAVSLPLNSSPLVANHTSMVPSR